MSIPLNANDLNPESLRQVIEQLQKELPDLLGSDYLSFSRELELLLPQGSDDELLALFASHPVAYDRLQELLNYLTAGHGLYGDSISIRSSVRYICPIGPHSVDGSEVQKRDVVGRPLCPIHGKAMKTAN